MNKSDPPTSLLPRGERIGEGVFCSSMRKGVEIFSRNVFREDSTWSAVLPYLPHMNIHG
jgi:hypothetical protein